MSEFDFASRIRADDGRSRNDPEPFHRELPSSIISDGGADGVVHQVGTRASDGDERSILVYVDGSNLCLARDCDELDLSIRLDAVDELIEALRSLRNLHR